MPELLIASALAAALAALASDFLSSILRSYPKKLSVVIKRESTSYPYEIRKKETLLIRSGVTDVEAISKVIRNLEFKKNIFHALSFYEVRSSDKEVQPGQYADFLVQAGGKMLAIEANTDLEELDPDLIADLFRKEPGIDKLFLVSAKSYLKQSVDSETQRYLAKRFVSLLGSDRISFVQVPDDNQLPFVLRDALDNELEKSS